MPECISCRQPFTVDDTDRAFHASVSPTFNGKTYAIPAPTLCPTCRCQRRLAWRNEYNLFKRTCDSTGKQILSIYPPESPHKVYGHREWNSPDWDGLEEGREVDFSRPFFAQFDELHRAVPLLSLNLQADNENCDYTNLVTRNKNCYLIFAANDNEDCYYCNYMHFSRDTVDSFFVFHCERCYECVDCERCHSLTHSAYCENCSESALLLHCRNCRNCIGCVGLVNKEYHLFNEASTKEEIERTLQEIRTNRRAFERAMEKLRTLRETVPHKYYAGTQNENVIGDHVFYSKDVFWCFDCTRLEDCRYCTWLHQSKHCQDCYAWGLTGELGYENHLCGNGFYNVRFSESCWNAVSDLLYCRYCINGTKDCFGCVGLKKRQYCILNKQYTKEEYEQLAGRLIEHMQKTGEWGEFFPPSISPFPYNVSLASQYFPLTREETLARGWQWRDEPPSAPIPATLPSEKISEDIAKVPDSITEEILACESCGKNYRIIPQELKFYRATGLPIPRSCYDCRALCRRQSRNPRYLWKRACAKCSAEIQTSYAPERAETVYCEKCYLEAVY